MREQPKDSEVGRLAPSVVPELTMDGTPQAPVRYRAAFTVRAPTTPPRSARSTRSGQWRSIAPTFRSELLTPDS